MPKLWPAKEKKSKKKLRRPGIEPESREWESRMLTITPTTLRNIDGKNGCIYRTVFHVPVGIFTE